MSRVGEMYKRQSKKEDDVMPKSYTKISKSGNRQVVSIKKSTLELAGLTVGDMVEIKAKSGEIIITKSNSFKEKRRTFVENGGQYERGEYDWSKPIGREEY